MYARYAYYMIYAIYKNIQASLQVFTQEGLKLRGAVAWLDGEKLMWMDMSFPHKMLNSEISPPKKMLFNFGIISLI